MFEVVLLYFFDSHLSSLSVWTFITYKNYNGFHLLIKASRVVQCLKGKRIMWPLKTDKQKVEK